MANLPRGCRAEDAESGELLLLGHRGKGYDRNAAETQRPATRPWAVVSPVHQAIRCSSQGIPAFRPGGNAIFGPEARSAGVLCACVVRVRLGASGSRCSP
ncbi:hypothetical protein, partial [Streptomyces luteolifulvus]|uniref:hypothetical protein n=1 Tax=Streptomyces luteolifulvus TaxID=2615112 RepID=UPI001CD9E6FD